ncbi:MAG TPA: FkbM family methyltransferase [Allosphingosinicella sp.]|nr:FkbM family methyltransferase [Allosphingosinicella sp.]
MLKSIQKALAVHPAPYKLIRSVWTPPKRIFRHLYFKGVFTVEVAPGACFRIESFGSKIENDLFWRGYGRGWEGTSLRVWRALAERSEFIADVGANTGVFALAAQALRPDARIVAVEPSHRVFEKLRRNIEINGFAIRPVEVAASDKAGIAKFYDLPTEHQYSASLEATMLGAGTVEVEVEVERLDHVFERCGFARLDLMKMDVERHEPAALRGMENMLRAHRPTMLIEVLDGEHLDGVKTVLDGLDYQFRAIAEESDASDADETGDASRNMLVCRQEVLDGLAGFESSLAPI